MALIEIHADLEKTATALTRIADALELLVEFYVDPAAISLHRKSRTSENREPPKPEERLRVVTDEALWEKEEQEEQARLAAAGQPSQSE